MFTKRKATQEARNLDERAKKLIFLLILKIIFLLTHLVPFVLYFKISKVVLPVHLCTFYIVFYFYFFYTVWLSVKV